MNEPVDPAAIRLRRLPSAALTEAEVRAILGLMDVAFGEDERFSDDDWHHALGGTHVVLELDGAIVAHASVVEREIRIGGRPFRAGYVEAVATAPGRQGRGLGTMVMTAINELVRDGFELGVLGTGQHGFYERLGWRTWRGPGFVRTATGVRRTPNEDGYLMILETPATPPLAPDAPIECDWRAGDVW